MNGKKEDWGGGARRHGSGCVLAETVYKLPAAADSRQVRAMSSAETHSGQSEISPCLLQQINAIRKVSIVHRDGLR